MIWLGYFLLSVAWLFIEPVYTTDSIPFIPFVLAGAACMVLFCRRSPTGRQEAPANGNTRYAPLWLLIPLAAWLAFMNLPYKIPAAFLAAAILLQVFLPKAGSFVRGFRLSGFILAAQATACLIFWKIEPRMPDDALLGRLASLLGIPAGMQSTNMGSTLYLNQTTGVTSFLSTWDKYGLFLLMVFAAGYVAVALCCRSRGRLPHLRVAAVVLLYSLVRYALLLTLLSDGGNADLAWWIPMQIASWALLPPALARWAPVDPPEGPPPEWRPVPWRAALYLLTAFLCVTVLLGYNEPGAPKGGRVVLDESHSDWEWSDKEYDTKWYGQESGYNYNSLYDYLCHYYEMSRNYKTIDDKLLAGCDVLLLKTPTKAFSDAELDCIERFVHGGGSLFMIGDHTNVFGISANFNPLAARFGVQFRYDATYDLGSGALTEYNRPEMLPHPAVERLPTYLFGTSCSLESSLLNEDIITGYKLRSLDADYSQDNFFAEQGNGKGMRSGLMLQCVAARAGQGRVVVIADSTPFSNFWLFMPGKSELFLGIMGWLDRRNSFPAVSVAAGALAALSLACLIWMCARKKVAMGAAASALFAALALAVPAGVALCSGLNLLNYTVPKPVTPFVTVAYDRQYSDFAIPATWQEFMEPAERQMDTFFVWNQRQKLVPRAANALNDALEGDVIVVANPAKPVSTADGLALQEAVKNGKSLLLMGGKPQNREAFDSFAKLFGVEMSLTPVRGEKAAYAGNASVQLSDIAWPLEGGTPIITSDSCKTMGSMVQYGNGKVIVFGDVDLFFENVMGTTNSLPVEGQKAIYDLEFWLFGQLLDMEGE